VGGLLLVLGFAIGFQYATWTEASPPPGPEEPEDPGQTQKPAEPEEPGEEEPTEQEPGDSTGVAPRDIDRYPRSLVGETTWDLDHDGTDEEIELHVDADREQGQFIWDDGQRWLLLVRDGEKTYPLYDAFVPLGVVEFWVFSEEPELVFKVEEGVRLMMYTVKYNAESDEYVLALVLNAENLMHRTVIH